MLRAWPAVVCVLLAGCSTLPCFGETYTELRWEDDVVAQTPQLDWAGAGWPRDPPLPFSVDAIGWHPQGGVLAWVSLDELSLSGIPQRDGANQTHAWVMWDSVQGDPVRSQVESFLQATTDADAEQVEAWADTLMAGQTREGVDIDIHDHSVNVPLARLDLEPLWQADGAVFDHGRSDPAYRVVWTGAEARWLFVAHRMGVDCDDAFIDLYGNGIVHASWDEGVGESSFRQRVADCLEPVGLEVPADARFRRECG